MPLAVHAAVVGRSWSRLPCSPCSVVAPTHRPVTHPAPIPQSWATPTAIASRSPAWHCTARRFFLA